MRRAMMGAMMGPAMAAAMALAGVAAARPAAAQSVDAANPASVVAAVQAAGYRATLDKTKEGNPIIRSAANGRNFSIVFDDCKDGCKTLGFYAYYKRAPVHTLEAINKWNADKKFLRVYIDSDGDLSTDYQITTVGTIPRANFADALDWFVVMSAELNRVLAVP